MSWEILLVISLISLSVSILVQKVLLKNITYDIYSFCFIFLLFIGLINGLLVVINGFKINYSSTLIPYLALSVFLYSIGHIAKLKAIQSADVSNFSIIFSSKTVWSIAAAFIFLGESFTPKQFFGAFLILGSVALISWEKKQISLSKGTGLSILSAILFGLAFINDAFLLKSISIYLLLFIGFTLPALAIAMVKPHTIKNLKPWLKPQNLLKLTIVSLFFALSAICLDAAYLKGNNAAQIAVISNLGTVITVALAIIFLKEKRGLLKKGLAAILSFIGLTLVG